MFCATLTMAPARRRSSVPRSRLTSAAARLIRPSARTSSIGMRSEPMRKLCSERSVCAPHNRSAGISSGPKASLSLRVFGLRGLAMACPRAGGALFLAEAVEPDDFGAAFGLCGLGLAGGLGRHRRYRRAHLGLGGFLRRPLGGLVLELFGVVGGRGFRGLFADLLELQAELRGGRRRDRGSRARQKR